MVKFRLYYDKDKEEIWLNEMAQEGWAMRGFFLGFYWFEPCEKGEYIYQVDLFTEPMRSMTHAEYVNLIEETGAEYIGKWGWWRFFRRRTELGKFQLYTDNSSKVEQAQRISRFFQKALILEICILLYDLIAAGFLIYHRAPVGIIIVCCLFMLLITGGIGNVCIKTKNKIKKLENELV